MRFKLISAKQKLKVMDFMDYDVLWRSDLCLDFKSLWIKMFGGDFGIRRGAPSVARLDPDPSDSSSTRHVGSVRPTYVLGG